MKISCIIIEDEPLAAEKLSNFVKSLPWLHLLSVHDNATDALDTIANHQPQLLFLDINMPGISGIQLLESALVQGQVIITTAYEQYALKGYDLNVTDYLLKPYTFERFVQAVEKVKNGFQVKQVPPKDIIFIKSAYRLEKVLINDILYIEGKRDYRCIVTNSRKIMTLQTFGELEQKLQPNRVCRVHKSYMVNINKIDVIEKDAVVINEQIIPVSDSYKKQLLALIGRS